MAILPSHESSSFIWLSFACFFILSFSSFLMYSMIPDQPPRAWIQLTALSFIPSFTTVFGIMSISSERPFFAKSDATEAAKHIRLFKAQSGINFMQSSLISKLFLMITNQFILFDAKRFSLKSWITSVIVLWSARSTLELLKFWMAEGKYRSCFDISAKRDG